MRVLFIRTCIALVIVLLAATGVWIGQKIAADPGYVLFAFNGTTVETSLWFFVTIVVITIITVYILLWMVHRTLTSTTIFSQWLQHRSQQQAIEKTNRGLLALMAGLWKEAQPHLLKAAASAESPVINYVAAARAAEQLGDAKACDEALLKAEEASNHSFVVLLTRADIQLKRGQVAVARYELERLYTRHPTHTQVLDLLRKAYYQEKNWARLNQLLGALKKHKVVLAEEWAVLDQQVAQHLLINIAHDDSSIENRLATLNSQWKSLSSSQIRNIEVVATYAQCLMKLHADHDAEVILKDCLRKTWNEPCIRLMGQIEGGDAAGRLTMVEKWLRDHPHDAVLLLTLGRISLRNQLWGKARTYFQESLHLNHSVEAYAELGRLCASLSEEELSANYFRQGLLLAHPLPELPMPLLNNQKISPHLR